MSSLAWICAFAGVPQLDIFLVWQQGRRELTIFVFSGSGSISLIWSSESIYINGLVPTFGEDFTCSWLLTWFSYRVWGPLYLLVPPRMFFMGGSHNSCFHFPFPLFLVQESVWPELSARKDGHLERRWDFGIALGCIFLAGAEQIGCEELKFYFLFFFCDNSTPALCSFYECM